MGGVTRRSDRARRSHRRRAVAIYLALVGMYTKFADLAARRRAGHARARPHRRARARRRVRGDAPSHRRGGAHAVPFAGGRRRGGLDGARRPASSSRRAVCVRGLVRCRSHPRGLHLGHPGADRLPDVRQGRPGRPRRPRSGCAVVGGAIGGFARTAPANVRRPATTGLLAVLLLGMLQRIVPIVFVELGFRGGLAVPPRARTDVFGGGHRLRRRCRGRASTGIDAGRPQAVDSARPCRPSHPLGSACWSGSSRCCSPCPCFWAL